MYSQPIVNFKRGLMLAATLSLLAGCDYQRPHETLSAAPLNTIKIKPQPVAAPSAKSKETSQNSASNTESQTVDKPAEEAPKPEKPVEQAIEEPTDNPSPSAAPSLAPSSSGGSSGSSSGGSSGGSSGSSSSTTPTPTPIPTPTPTPTPTPDIPRAIIDGVVFISKHESIDSEGRYGAVPADPVGVTVTARSLDSNVPFEASTTTIAMGVYVLENVPVGVRMEFTASKPGYTARSFIAVPQPNPLGDPHINRLDFGASVSKVYLSGNFICRLTDYPEVTAMNPDREQTVDPNTSFKLTFSVPMDTASVEHNFGIYPEDGQNLSVGVNLHEHNLSESIGCGDLVWDSSAFDVSWNNDDTEVTFTFKDEKQLPSDTDPERVPKYEVSLKAHYKGYLDPAEGLVKSKTGTPIYVNSSITRSQFPPYPLGRGIFYRRYPLPDDPIQYTYRGENFGHETTISYKFYATPDQQPPRLSAATVLSAEGGHAAGDAIQVAFSEPMRFVTYNNEVMGGYLDSSHSPLNAANYFVSVNGGTEFAWSDQGTVAFDPDDPTHKTVSLLLSNTASNVWTTGDQVTVRVSSTVMDPAGNTVNTTNNNDRSSDTSG